MVNYHKVSLVPLNPRAEKLIGKYDNGLLMQEYDSMGRPLCIAPNGKQAIFCVSPDGFWNGWLVLDEDIRFEKEQNDIKKILQNLEELQHLLSS